MDLPVIDDSSATTSSRAGGTAKNVRTSLDELSTVSLEQSYLRGSLQAVASSQELHLFDA